MPAHETCEFTFSQIVKLSAMDMKEFHQMFSGRSGTKAMDFRREIQKAMRDYANKIHGFDAVKIGLIEKCHTIEKWCRIRFYKDRVKYWQDQGVEYISAKAKARQEWEAYCARAGY